MQAKQKGAWSWILLTSKCTCMQYIYPTTKLETEVTNLTNWPMGLTNYTWGEEKILTES